MPVELKKEIDLPIGARSLLPMRDFLGRCMTQAELEPGVQRDLTGALDGAIISALVGGHEQGRRGHISLEVDINPTRMRLLLRDDSEGVELKDEGARGSLKRVTARSRDLSLDLLRQSMDEVAYRYRRGFENELELVKFL